MSKRDRAEQRRRHRNRLVIAVSAVAVALPGMLGRVVPARLANISRAGARPRVSSSSGSRPPSLDEHVQAPVRVRGQGVRRSPVRPNSEVPMPAPRRSHPFAIRRPR